MWHIVLGSVLAFMGGLVAFFIQWKWNQCKQRETVRVFIREIKNMNTQAESLIKRLEK